MVHQRVFNAARQYPRSIAVRDGERAVPYGELLSFAADLAEHLADPTEEHTAVLLDLGKSWHTVGAMLACLAAGRPYVVIDHEAPTSRRRFVAEDCGATVLCGDLSRWGPALPASLRRSFDPRRGWTSHEALEPGVKFPDTAASVLYTSGSTGRPKGVLISAGNISAFCDWASDALPLDTRDVVAVHAPLHFDLPVYDIYCGLAAGATLQLVDGQSALFPAALWSLLHRAEVSVMYAVPSAWISLLERSPLATAGLPHLRRAMYAGEEFHVPALARLRRVLPDTEIVNLYGPVETNVVTCHTVTDADLTLQHVPVGRPVTGTEVELIDEDRRLIPTPGVEGEIVVAGPSVCMGYLNDEAKTHSSFVRLSPQGPLWYRTGDFAHRDDAGVLHLHGRRDGMVKTRGFRVELGDIEAALCRHPGVVEAAAFAIPDERHTTLIHAAVTCRDDGIGAAELVAWCRGELPGYMVPSAIRVRSFLPRTSTGKADRQALRAETMVAAGQGATR